MRLLDYIVTARLPRFLLAAVAAAVFLVPTPSASAQTRTADNILIGQANQSGMDVAWGTADGVIDAPIDRVMAVVGDYANYNQFMPHFRTSRVLAQRGNRAMVYFEVGILRDTATLWARMRIQRQADQGDTRVIVASLVEGNMDAFRARWEITPVDATHTRINFRILVAPDLPVPDSLMTEQNVKAARNTVRAIRRRV